MKIAITLLLYVLAYGWGWRMLRGEGHRRRRSYLAALWRTGLILIYAVLPILLICHWASCIRRSFSLWAEPLSIG